MAAVERLARDAGHAHGTPEENRLEVVYRASVEVGSAVLTAVATTVVSFLPVFTMIGSEGKLFKPLAFTKTFALISSVIVALTIIPPIAHVLIAGTIRRTRVKNIALLGLAIAGLVLAITVTWWFGLLVIAFALYHLFSHRIPQRVRQAAPWLSTALGGSIPNRPPGEASLV